MKRLTVGQAIAAATFAARLGGCTCNPAVTFTEISPGVNVAHVAHDEACGHGGCAPGCKCALCDLMRGPRPTQAGGAA